MRSRRARGNESTKRSRPGRCLMTHFRQQNFTRHFLAFSERSAKATNSDMWPKVGTLNMPVSACDVKLIMKKLMKKLGQRLFGGGRRLAPLSYVFCLPQTEGKISFLRTKSALSPVFTEVVDPRKRCKSLERERGYLKMTSAPMRANSTK